MKGHKGYRVPRSPNAPLSPAELNALRRVASGMADSMGLIAVTLQGSLMMTDEGRARLAALSGEQPPIKRTQPTAD